MNFIVLNKKKFDFSLEYIFQPELNDSSYCRELVGMFKGTGSVISKYPPSKDSNARFTTRDTL